MLLHGLPVSILEGVLWGLIWPNTIAKQFGNSEKAKVLGGLASLGAVTSWLGPLAGDLSDREWPWTQRFGRRRPFVLVAHVIWTGGLILTWHGPPPSPPAPFPRTPAPDLPRPASLRAGLNTKNLPLMVTANVIGSLAGVLGNPNWQALPAETVPASQRGKMIAVQSQIVALQQFVQSGVGVLVGEGVLDKYFWGDDTIWYAIIIWDLLRPPLMMMAFNSKAGWWHPEIEPQKVTPRQPEDYRRGANRYLSDDYRGGQYLGRASGARGGTNCCRVFLSWLRSFFSAFIEDSAFRWLWFNGLFAACGGAFISQFFFYYMQDAYTDEPNCVGDSCARTYAVFGHKIT